MKANEAVETIDLTPTWGEWANLYRRLAESGEVKAVRLLGADLAKAMAAAQALQSITGTLSDEQRATVSKVMSVELAKQGFA